MVVICGALVSSNSRATSAVFHFVADITEYYGANYVPAPNGHARHVFFNEESPTLRLAFGNRSETPQMLTTSGIPISQAFRLRALQLPPGAELPRLIADEHGAVRGGGGNQQRVWGQNVEVPGRSSVTFSSQLIFGPRATPGVYVLLVTPVSDAITADLILLGTGVAYELRAQSSVEEQAEVIRRRMMRAYGSDRFDEAEAEGRELLRLYPRSSAAYFVKGEAARRAGRRQQALDAYRFARQLLTIGNDDLFLRYATPSRIKDAIDQLSRSIEHVQ